MNTIVRVIRASELPPSLRDAFDPAATVEVSVRHLGDEGLKEDMLDLIERRHSFREANPEFQEPDPIGRDRALRDEWD